MTNTYTATKYTINKDTTVTFEAESLEEAKEIALAKLRYRKIYKCGLNIVTIYNEQGEELTSYSVRWIGEKTGNHWSH